MLRLGALDFAGEEHGLRGGPPALAARALGDLASGRAQGGGLAVEQLCAALIGDDPDAARTCADRILACGLSIEAVYESYIPRAAARLGELWLDDRLAFAGVTLAMARLTDVFRRLSPAFQRERPAGRPEERPPERPLGRRALFALTPGEDHALGVVMAADWFQRAGWSVRVELRADVDRLEALARAEPFDLVGLSAGGRRMLAPARAAFARLRAARPKARFALGGPVVALEPAAAALVGADFAHGSASAALEELDRGW